MDQTQTGKPNTAVAASLFINNLPDFDIKPELVVPQIEVLLAEGRAVVAGVTAITAPTWESVGVPLDAIAHKIESAWTPVEHLNGVMKTEALEVAHDIAEKLQVTYGTEVMQNKRLYDLFLALKNGPEFAGYSPARKRVVEKYLESAELSGVDLPDVKKKRFTEIQERLTDLQNKFEQHVLGAMGKWKSHITDPARVSGIPEDTLAQAKKRAEDDDKSGWLFALDDSTYVSVISFADDQKLREEFYLGWVTRASDRGPSAYEFDNAPLAAELLALRHEKAKLLGRANYAELSIAKKMVSSTDEVMSFLTDLNTRAHGAAAKELEELKAFAKSKFGINHLYPWDLAYFSEKLRTETFAIAQKELKQYFPIELVLAGMFGVVHRLYGITIAKREGVKTWHKDVRFYEIHDKDGNLRGQFYLDPYARSGTKRGGAWMGTCVSRMKTADGRVHLPVAYLTCNSTEPTGAKPGLVSFREVETLFHEFGHGLHHMLTLVDELDVSGIGGVEWDAVELPSQFMENFCLEWDVLQEMTRHADTGAKLPRDMFDRLVAAKNFQSALGFVRQLEFAIFDFRLYREYDPVVGPRVLELLDEVRSQVRVIPSMIYDRMPMSFTHIFSGGYAAGYFSYKWAEVLSADAFSLFEEEGVFNQKTGESFLKNILEVGGSRPMSESFSVFRGRAPTVDALLRHSGLA